MSNPAAGFEKIGGSASFYEQDVKTGKRCPKGETPMPCVYILLTRTDTLFARLLHGMGGNRYTHASLALDRDLGRMYSFARRYEPFMLPGGFIRENIHAGVFGRCGGADSLLLELPVSRATYEAIERQMTVMASAGSCWD